MNQDLATMSNVELVAEYRAAKEQGKAARVKQVQTAFLRKNERLVKKFAKRYAPNRSSDIDDIMQAGSMGLLRALDDFDPGRGIKLSTYAAWWIRDHIQHWGGKEKTVSKGRNGRMPASVAAAAAKHRLLHGTEPTAEDLGVAPEKLAEWSIGSHMVELDAPVGDDDEGGVELTDDADAASHANERMVLEAVWGAAMSKLSERNRQVAEAVFWNGETAVAVAKRFGLSRVNVTKICARVEETLKRAVRASSETEDQEADERYRRVHELHDQGRTLKEIGAVMGAHVASVRRWGRFDVPRLPMSERAIPS